MWLTHPARLGLRILKAIKECPMLKTTLLFVCTALAEIIGCFLPYLWLRKNGSILLLIPATASLALFVWLLTCIPQRAGVYMPLTAASMLLPHWHGFISWME
jgi:hypothetical protein